MPGKQYTTKQLESMALDVAKKNNLFTIKDIVAYLPISKQTFYNHKLDEVDSIKEQIEENIMKTKQSMRQKWYKSSNPTLQVALMKLIGDDDDRKRLTQQHVDHTTDGKELPAPQVYMPADLSDAELGMPAA